ncbi:MAG: class I SAM-dependent methyltransferase [Thermoplasmata archaeon]|nr:MAG: class I SAM-dependent methyltransferase [Thermoplasmata archaeon]
MQKSKRMHDRLFIFLEKYLSSLPFRHAYIKFFEKATLEEFKMVGISIDDNVLHVGCGALPNTLITLAKHIKASYVGIDRDEEAVETAKKIVEEYGLENVEVERGDALDYPIKDFDVIIISFGVEPKEKVFERIREEGKEGVKIVYRKQWDFMDVIYGRKDFLPSGFKIVAEHNRRDFIKSYLLKVS